MPALDFWFSTGSVYAYLTVNRIEALAAGAGVAVRWRSFDLRGLMGATGAGPVFPEGSAKRRHMFRDIGRRAARLGIPCGSPPPHPTDPDFLCQRVALVAEDEGWLPAFARAHFRAWYLDHRPSGDGEAMAPLLASLGRDPRPILDAARSEAVTRRMQGTVDEALRLGLFGSPHFVVGDEVFWGDDRLEDALDWATGSAGWTARAGRPPPPA